MGYCATSSPFCNFPHVVPEVWEIVLLVWIVVIPASVAVGFGLTLAAFYPGVMSEDARYVYDDIARGFLGDWQSPVEGK